MIKAILNGIKSVFSDNDWASGQPQRRGWQEIGKERKTLPKEIIDYAFRKKLPVSETVKLDNGQEVVMNYDEPKLKKDDNPKQKNRTTGKLKPRKVGKA
jgi:hypothetical protein